MEENESKVLNTIELWNGEIIEYEDDNFPQDIVKTANDEWARFENVVEINGYYYLQDSDEIVYDDYNGGYILFENSVKGIIYKTGRIGIFHIDNSIYIEEEDTYYASEELANHFGWFYDDFLNKYVKKQLIEPEILAQRRLDLEESADLFYPNHWDWVGDYFVIYFPELYVANNSSRHKIYDLYVGLLFNNLTGTISGSLYGCRSTYSIPEVNANYTHSHLYSGLKTRFSPFCLGSGDLSTMLPHLNVEWSRELVDNIMLTIDTTVRHESTEGKPYIRISSINKGNKLPKKLPTYSCDREFKKLIANDIKSIHWDDNLNCVELNYEEIESILTEKGTGRNLCFYNPITQQYFTESSNTLTRTFNEGESLFIFKGNEVNKKLIKEKQSTEAVEKRINPYVTKYCIQKLSKLLTERIIDEKRNATKTNDSN